MSAERRRDRKRGRLLAHGIASVVAVATTAGALAVASPGVPGAPAAATAAPGTELQARFEEAAREFGVPASVLMAVAYRQTRWESHGGRPSTTGAYNVMGLTRVDPEDLEDPEDGHGGGDDEHRLAHMNRSGDPEVERRFDAERALKSVRGKPVDTDDPRLHTLDEAARLAGASPDAVRVDPGQSVRAGAALLAEYQRRATGSLPDEPDGWYPAVARYSQAPDRRGARLFAERVFESIRTGERRTTGDGQRLSLPADPSVRPVRPSRVPLAAAPATAATAATAPAPDCPAGLDCDFRPAAYEQNSGPDDWGNYTVAGRPGNGQDIRYIVIHDTEGGYAGSLSVFQNPGTYASAHYLIRASDGLVTQMVENRNEAWHAGNKTLNTHSIGIEHEGYAIKEGSWYTEPQYESSAALVRHLAAKYRIPLDREHVIGHDEVPGALDTKVRPMHWDPGPFWDWNHYMALMGAPTGAGGARRPAQGRAARPLRAAVHPGQPAEADRRGCRGHPAAGEPRLPVHVALHRFGHSRRPLPGRADLERGLELGQQARRRRDVRRRRGAQRLDGDLARRPEGVVPQPGRPVHRAGAVRDRAAGRGRRDGRGVRARLPGGRGVRGHGRAGAGPERRPPDEVRAPGRAAVRVGRRGRAGHVLPQGHVRRHGPRLADAGAGEELVPPRPLQPPPRVGRRGRRGGGRPHRAGPGNRPPQRPRPRRLRRAVAVPGHRRRHLPVLRPLPRGRRLGRVRPGHPGDGAARRRQGRRGGP
nr:peptidoglycan recognition family protein [Streptomyces somaliensis]